MGECPRRPRYTIIRIALFQRVSGGMVNETRRDYFAASLFCVFNRPKIAAIFFLSIGIFLRSTIEKIINKTDIEDVIERKIDKQQFWAWPA